MAEENAIGGLIERVKAEGQLTRNTGTNSIKVTNELLVVVSERLQGVNNTLDTVANYLSDSIEMTKEMLDDIKDAALLTPPDSGGGPQPANDPAPAGDTSIKEDTKNTIAVFGGLGLLGKAIALALGGALGVISGQLKAIKSVAKLLTPAAWQTSLSGLKTALDTRLEALKTAIGDKVKGVRTAIVNGMTRLGDLFKIDPDSNIGKAITRFKGFFSPITKMLSDASETLKGIAGAGEGKGPLSRIKNWFNILKGYLGSFGKSISGIGRIVGKIFAPIAIIMTAFDTVKGAIEGYAEGGLLGGLQGAIDGLFTSLITKPLDLLKSAVAWVLDKLGFDSSADALNSFSFTELWTGLTDKIFSGVKDALKVVTDLFTFGEEDKTAMGLLGKLTDLVYAPVNMAINFVRSLFGWSSEDETEPFKLNDYIAEMFGKGIAWAKDALSGVGETIKVKFNEMAEWISGIPDRVTIQAKIMYENLKAKLQAGFLMFGEWFASIPDKIKLIALETIRSLPGGGLLVGEDDIQDARANVENRSNDMDQRLQAIEDQRVARLAELESQAAALQQNNTVVNNGGNSTTQTTNNYYQSTGSSNSLDPADPRAFAGR